MLLFSSKREMSLKCCMYVIEGAVFLVLIFTGSSLQ